MARIAVFDSGLGSLSVIRAIQRHTRCEIIYFADQKNFPYGSKTESELGRIITETVSMLQERFSPDLIVVGSNTPTVLLEIGSERVIGVSPPIRDAARLSRTKNIAVLATGALTKSAALTDYIRAQKLPAGVRVHRINCSNLVGLVESGAFVSDRGRTERQVTRTVGKALGQKGIDVATLSSTHLPFLREFFERRFPEIRFVDPAERVARGIAQRIRPAKRNSLRILSTDGTGTFQRSLGRMGIKNRVTFL